MIFRVLAYAFLLGSVSWGEVPASPASGVSAPPELRLLQACVEKGGGNVMVSPFSLYEVLRYALPGAAGETERQIAAVLPGDGAIRKDWIFLSEDFSRSLRCYSANRIFADRTVELKDAYKRAVGAAGVAPAPFRENPAAAVRGASLFFAGGKGAPVFMAILPPEGKKLKQFIAGLTAEEWNGLLTALSVRHAVEKTRKPGARPLEQYTRYHLQLPRFSQSSPTLSLKEALKALGMKDAFNEYADFSRMGSCEGEPLRIHDVYQKCAIRVREEGLEASVSTAGAMDPFAGPPPRGKGPEIEFNCPFLWLIYSPADRAVLFMGTYEGPENGRKKGTP